jgi:hypothetical protein
MQARSLFCLGVVVLLAACPTRTPPPRRAAPATLEDLERRLVLPLDPSVPAALAELERRRAAGDVAAGLAATRFLVDLYDWARLTGQAPARELLWQALALPAPARRGLKATAAALEALLARLTAPGTPPSAFAALLRSERAFLDDRGRLAEHVRELKAALAGPAAPGAAFRLYALCAQAFRTAVLAAPGRRSAVLAHCLLPLTPVDPAPHLKVDTDLPAPPWTRYQAGLAALLERAGRQGLRPAALAAVLAAENRRFLAEERARLPLLLPDRPLAPLPEGRPYAGSAALILGPDRLEAAGEVIEKHTPRDVIVQVSRVFFAADRGTHLTVLGETATPMGALRPVIERAATTGFFTLGLGGTARLDRREGWYRTAAEPPLAIREIPLSLAPLAPAPAALKGISTETLRWDAACDARRLVVHVGDRTATPAGPDGDLPPLPAATTSEALLLALERLHQAFPEACAVSLTFDDALSYGEALAALRHLSVARTPATEAFRFLGLRTGFVAAPPAGNAFLARAEARLGARVTLPRWPRARAASAPALVRRLRTCYLPALDGAPARWALYDVRLGEGKPLVSLIRGTQPEELSLTECLSGAVDTWRQVGGVTGAMRFQVELRPAEVKAKPKGKEAKPKGKEAKPKEKAGRGRGVR